MISGSSDDDVLLRVRDLRVRLPTGRGRSVEAVKDVSLTVRAGQRVGLVGESGSGKSVTVRAVSGLLPRSRGVEVHGSIRFGGRELIGAPERDWRRVRSEGVSMVFQDPSTYLNPTMRIGRQVREALVRGRSADHSDAALRRFLSLAGLSDPGVADRYPFELSGGMRQRALIAVALAKMPELIIADEPTTALDATVQRRVLRSLDASVTQLDSALLLITHDLAVVAGMCDVVFVMYDGRIVESGPVEAIFDRPRHDYTRELLRCVRVLSDDTPDLHVSSYRGQR